MAEYLINELVEPGIIDHLNYLKIEAERVDNLILSLKSNRYLPKKNIFYKLKAFFYGLG